MTQGQRLPIGVRAATAKQFLDQAQDYLLQGGKSAQRPFAHAMGKALSNINRVKAVAAFNILAKRYNELANSRTDIKLLELRVHDEEGDGTSDRKPPQRSKLYHELHMRAASTPQPLAAVLPPAPPPSA
ncbi:hypothetical protein G6L97_04200 [Agrobacterium tumefaciens]|uniref:hypothetical protein n=1 Tax=Agrobacterium tumefaciens TaxID=358 RepID=UPI00157493DD|nr:hypothetical protein [Agrobacterium tumefaciens]NSZ83614.1 hypothetical protein [Agrobacterium tumefaciens]WCA69821.1 hypothetical protein G6L97_04200 [Agrobacterium tumefaciens]